MLTEAKQCCGDVEAQRGDMKHRYTLCPFSAPKASSADRIILCWTPAA